MILSTLVLLLAKEPVTLQDRLSAIGRTLEEQRIKDGVPGAALVIVKDGKVVLLKGFGVRSLKNKQPVDADTLFSVQSISKTFTATAFMKAVDEGRMAVDDRPGKYLPWLKFKDPELEAKVTFRDLLSHRSGLAGADYVWMPGVLSRKEAIQVAAGAVPTAKIGERLQYNNLMFSAVGDATGAAYKLSWERVIQTNLLTPLQMTRTRTSHAEMFKDPNHAETYDPNPNTGVIEQIPDLAVSSIAPASAICSSARDMAKWLTVSLADGAYDGGRLMSEARWQEMMTLQFRLGAPGGWLLGWSRRDWRGHKLIFHSGGGYGWTTLMALMPEEHVGFVFLCNLTSANLRNVVAEAVWSNLIDSKPEAVREGLKPVNDVPKVQLAPPDLRNQAIEAAVRPGVSPRSIRLDCDIEYPQQGLTGQGTIYWEKPNRVSRQMTLQVGKRKIADLQVSLEGEAGRAAWSFLRPGPLSLSDRNDARMLNDLPPLAFAPLGNWDGATVDQVGGGAVYAVKRMPGVTEYFSTKTLQLLSRELASGYRQEFSDWRPQDGLLVPFLIRERQPALGEAVWKVKRVTLNAPAPSASIDARPQQSGERMTWGWR